MAPDPSDDPAPPNDPALRLLVRHSGSPKDTALAEELLGHLRPLERFAGMDVWANDRILCAGDHARHEAAAAIGDADIALSCLPDSPRGTRFGTLRCRSSSTGIGRADFGLSRLLRFLAPGRCTRGWWTSTRSPRAEDRSLRFDGDRRAQMLSEIAREIGKLAPLQRSIVATERGARPAISPRPHQPAPTASNGGTTFNIHISNSTIGSFGAGDGAIASSERGGRPQTASHDWMPPLQPSFPPRRGARPSEAPQRPPKQVTIELAIQEDILLRRYAFPSGELTPWVDGGPMMP